MTMVIYRTYGHAAKVIVGLSCSKQEPYHSFTKHFQDKPGCPYLGRASETPKALDPASQTWSHILQGKNHHLLVEEQEVTPLAYQSFFRVRAFDDPFKI